MIRKVIISIGIITLFQSCIKQDEVDVDGIISIEEKAIPLKIGESFTLQASYVEAGKTFNENGENNNPIKYEYTVDKPSIVSVSPSGEVKGLQNGNATVMISAFGSPTKLQVFNIVVNNTDIAHIEVQDFPSFIATETTKQLKALVKDYDGNEKPNVSIDKWASTDTSIVKINKNGEITSVKKGVVRIQASIGEVISFPYSLTIIDATSRSGQFQKIDYRTEGQGRLVLNPDNSLDIIFEDDFEAENATGLPGVEVYLNNGTDPNVAISSGLKVGAIPQNKGRFTMSVPIPDGQSGVDVFTKYSHILLICEPFKISFGAAKLN